MICVGSSKLHPLSDSVFASHKREQLERPFSVAFNYCRQEQLCNLPVRPSCCGSEMALHGESTLGRALSCCFENLGQQSSHVIQEFQLGGFFRS